MNIERAREVEPRLRALVLAAHRVGRAHHAVAAEGHVARHEDRVRRRDVEPLGPGDGHVARDLAEHHLLVPAVRRITVADVDVREVHPGEKNLVHTRRRAYHAGPAFRP